jgi:hypothetical protein
MGIGGWDIHQERLEDSMDGCQPCLLQWQDPRHVVGGKEVEPNCAVG